MKRISFIFTVFLLLISTKYVYCQNRLYTEKLFERTGLPYDVDVVIGQDSVVCFGAITIFNDVFFSFHFDSIVFNKFLKINNVNYCDFFNHKDVTYSFIKSKGFLFQVNGVVYKKLKYLPSVVLRKTDEISQIEFRALNEFEKSRYKSFSYIFILNSQIPR